MLRAGGDGDVTPIRERDELHGVFETLRGSDVSGDDGEGADVEFRRIQGEHDGHGVVGARVGINDDFSGLGGGTFIKEKRKKAKKKSERVRSIREGPP